MLRGDDEGTKRVAVETDAAKDEPGEDGRPADRLRAQLQSKRVDLDDWKGVGPHRSRSEGEDQDRGKKPGSPPHCAPPCRSETTRDDALIRPLTSKSNDAIRPYAGCSFAYFASSFFTPTVLKRTVIF